MEDDGDPATVAAVVPLGLAMDPGTTLPRASVALMIPMATLVLYLVANRVARHPQERPWDGRVRAGAVALATALPLVLLLAA